MWHSKKILIVLVVLLCARITSLWAKPRASKDSLTVNPLLNEEIVDRWIAPDKGLHLLGSMMLTVAGSKTLQQNFGVKSQASKTWAMSFTFCLGVGKEVRDSTRPHNIFSWKDLTADIIGILIGRGILELK